MPAAVTRDAALALLVQERAPEIIEAATEQSVALTTFRRQTIGTNKTKFAFLDTLPKAQWLTNNADDMQVKPPVGSLSWSPYEIGVEEVAGTAVIAENVLDDTEYGLWNEVRARVSEAVGQLIDSTVFFGTSPYGDPVPATFPTGGIVGRTVAAGKNVAYDGADFFNSLNAAMAEVEDSGFDPSRGFGPRSIAPLLRNTRDHNGQFLYATDARSGQQVNTVWGVPLEFLNRRIWDKSLASLLLGDISTTRIVMRQDLTVKMLDQATIQGINLAEQDAIGMRVKMRLGWGILPNPERFAGDEADFPYAIVDPDPANVPAP
jgi:HK97 family phage major capsid protein